MNLFLQILYTVLLFGVLIFVHEFGHFLAAKLFRVRVNEFSIGMGPAILKKQGKETLYSLRLFPIGGFCAMEGEDEEAPEKPSEPSENAIEEDRSMRGKPVWQRMIIVTAGALMNLLLGVILVAVLVIAKPIPSTVVAEFDTDAISVESGLQVGDRIVAVDGEKISGYVGLSTALSRAYNRSSVSLKVVRDGVEIDLGEVTFPTESVDEDLFYPSVDFKVYRETKTVATVLKNTFTESVSYVKLMFQSIGDMITGKVSLKYVSGPIGISEAVSEAASYGWASVCSLAALISINLAVVNLLPLPALDGGRFLFMLIEAIARRPVPVKIEAIIHAVGMILLLALTVLIAFKDLFFPIY